MAIPLAVSRIPSTREKSSLLDLPDELLLVMLENMASNDLYSMASLCKRLHRLALPAYFACHGIFEPMNIPLRHLTLRGDQLNALPGLQLSLFVTSIRRLSCNFSHIESGEHLLNVIRGLHQLILKVNGSEDVTLDFQNCDHLLMAFQQCSRSMSDWVEACEGLLTAVADCCLFLTVNHGKLYEEASQFHLIAKEMARHTHVPVISRPFVALKKSLSFREGTSSRSWQAYVDPIPATSTHVRPSRLARPTLRRFRIQSPMLLLPPHCDWTFRILNASSITQLYLLHVPLSTMTWSRVLPCITISTLTHLSIGHCNIAFNDLARFLSRHPKIYKLALSGYYTPPYLPHLPKAILPRLASLHASPENLTHFLKPVGALPKLDSLSIRLVIYRGRQFNIAEVEQSISHVANRVRECALALEVIIESLSADWLSSPHQDELAAGERLLQQVTNVEFSVERGAASLLPTWLSLFPVLEHISFMNHSEGTWSRKDKVALLRQIAEKCTTIQHVTIEGEKRDIAVWLAMDDVKVTGESVRLASN